MLQYLLAGLALGSIYALAASSLVVTYESAGVLNFAFGSIAYVVARFYYWLNSQHGWATWTAGTVSIALFSPLIGIALYAALFRFVRGKSTLIKLVSTIGLSVALPPAAELLLGNQTVDNAPGLTLQSDKPLHFLGSPITTSQLVIYGFLVVVLVVGTVVLRFTDAGLRVRAVVDSEAMAMLSGVNPGRVALGVWAASATLAGLAGILVAPTNGLTTSGMTTLMAAAFAAVVAARLRSLPIAVSVSLVMGVVTDVIQKYLPANSALTADVIPSVPFAVMLVFLIAYAVRRRPEENERGVGGPLDRAILPSHQETATGSPFATSRWPGGTLSLLPLAVIALLPVIFHGSAYWLGLVALGFCYGITFLTFTVVTGEGGMLWLAQVIFAGAGAIATGQFNSVWHLPVLLSVVMGGLLAALVGAIIGLLTIRLGDLYVGLGTLTFGLLVETLIFTRSQFLHDGLGVAVARPGFATGNQAFAYLAFGVFIVFALLTLNLRRSTSGMALRAVRDSEPAARTLGLSVLQVKVIVGALGAFTAAVGGGFLAMYANVAQPQSFETFAGLVWLAVVVTMSVRSVTAAVLAGLSFSLLPGIFQSYVPARWGEIPAMLFGLGAVLVARHPDGAVLENGRQLRRLLASWFGRATLEDAAVQVSSVSGLPPAAGHSGRRTTVKAAP